MKDGRYESFAEFWPFYASEHSKLLTRWMHIFGTLSAALVVFFGVFSARYSLIPLGIVWGYTPAWISHFFIEKNRPATFKYPLWSFLGDWVMIARVLTGTFPK